MKCAKGKFTLIEQLWMQISFQGIWILGAIAIWQANHYISLAYVAFVSIGILFFIMHTWLCPNCPHIKEHGSCVQLPPIMTKQLIKDRPSKDMKLYEKIGFFIVLYGVFLIPLYWVIKLPIITVFYVVFGLMHYPAYFIWFCRKCMNKSCPQFMNKADL